MEHSDNPNLDRLKAVSLAAFQLWKSSRKSSQDLFNAFNMANCIVIDLLRLADEKEKAYHEGYDQGVTGQPRRKRITPAARKDDDGKH